MSGRLGSGCWFRLVFGQALARFDGGGVARQIFDGGLKLALFHQRGVYLGG
jgi:hypothetical protein